jgi:hypothetical protein
MKTIFSLMFCLFAAVAAAETISTDGTVSVLQTTATQTAPAQTATVATQTVQTATVATPAPVCDGCVETARLVKLSPWHTRRLNRIADRQETRDSKDCCCSKQSDCCKSKTLVVEGRSRKKCDCCK